MRLAQKRFLPDTEHWHLAEVFFSGLVQRSPFSPEKVTVLETWYEYKPEIRELLLENSSVQRTAEIWREIGDLIQYNYGSLRDFQALIYNPNGSIQDMAARRDLYFAEVKAAILMTWGGEYAALAGQLSLEVALGKQPKDQSVVQIKGFPPIETLQFDVATITVEDNTETPPRINLQTFEFEVALIHHPLSIHRHPQQAQYFIEDLGNGVQLEMIAIPEGNFLMGSPEDELQRSDSESPQHPVSIKPFYMGKYPITQAQWRAIALLPQVNRELKPDPSRFKGEDLPVEKVSWYDAVEFCDRLTRFVNERRLSECASKSYQLPSEAQWEYACRAGTTTPFHFGETIISDLANYDASSTYGVGVKGIYRGKTKPVGSFGVANAFGLYDMHGNVWEWCADHWHSNYKKAPNDETIWLFSNETFRLLRGGSWRNNPGDCRCASRYNDLAVNDGNNVGFRVVCGEL
ncbi:MAG: formylglycine-generating enzyme family protein [Aetokthonos hydrillicola CCALA 1050]|nr:formylglycine-generating enzyme family protein [Aetokthonos hydrillicola CCALA 1050]